MGVGGCQECYDDTYKNESFMTSKYMAGINEYVNKSLNEYLKNTRCSKKYVSKKATACAVCHDSIFDDRCVKDDSDNHYCLECLLVSLDSQNVVLTPSESSFVVDIYKI